MEDTELVRQLTEVQQSTKSAHHRIDTLEENQREIRDLTVTVGKLAVTVEGMQKNQDALINRICAVEARPGKRWEQLVGYLMAALATGIIGYLLGNLLK